MNMEIHAEEGDKRVRIFMEWKLAPGTFHQHYPECLSFYGCNVDVVEACWLTRVLTVLCVGPPWCEPGVTLA